MVLAIVSNLLGLRVSILSGTCNPFLFFLKGSHLRLFLKLVENSTIFMLV